MPDPFVESRIRHLPLCQVLTREDLELLSDAFQVLRLAPDTIVFQQGQVSQGLYLFVYGSAVLTQTNASGSTRPLAMVGEGQYINENALFAVVNENATLRIVEPALVLFLSRDVLRKFAAQDASLASALNRYIAARNRAADVPPPPPLVKPAPAHSSSQPLVQPAPPTVPSATPAAQPSVPLVQPAPVQPAPPPAQPIAQPTPPPAPQPTQPARPVVAPQPTPATASTLPVTPIAPPQVNPTNVPSPVVNPPAAVTPSPAAPVSPAAPPPIVPASSPATFAGQRENETVIMQRWRHWWAAGRFAWAPLFLLIGLIMLSLVVSVPFLQVVFTGAAVFIPGVTLLYLYREWHNDRLIITDERVIWIERKILSFENKFLELPIESIIEVVADYPQIDPFARLFNYGTLKLRTSGTAGNLALDLMPDPRGLQQVIFSGRDAHRQVLERQQRSVIRAEVNQMLEGKDSGKAVTHIPPSTSGGFHPLATRFINAKGETVYRKHWSIWLQHTTLPFLVILLGIALALVTLTREGDVRLFMLAVSAVPVILGGLWLYWSDWDWRNDQYIVGDDRITLIHQRPLWLQNKVDTISLAQVDSVATDQQGLFSALLNRGDVKLALEGADTPKKFESVQDPRGVAAEVSTRQARARQRVQEGQVRQQRQAVADYLSVYHETINQNPNQPYRPPAGQQAQSAPRPTDAERPPKFPRRQG
ncbi:MAG: cyclic nucleotide-binding domain-containing protein [Anaerolineae bacterium]